MATTQSEQGGGKRVCKLCVMEKGLRGSDLKNAPHFPKVDDMAVHLENKHHIVVKADDESVEQAEQRFERAHPGVREHCACPACCMYRTLNWEPLK